MWSPKETRGQAGSRTASQSYSLALIQYLENASFPCFRPQDHITDLKWEPKKKRKLSQIQTRSDRSVCEDLTSYKHTNPGMIHTNFERMCPWCIEFLSLFSLSPALHWQQQNHRGNRKGLSSLVLGRISSFGGVPPPPSLNSPSLYLFLSFFLPPNPFRSRCGISCLAELRSVPGTTFPLILGYHIWVKYVLAWWRGGWGQLGGEVVLALICL